MFAFLKKINSFFAWIGNFLQPFILLAMRLFWGWAFFQAGYGKLENISDIIVYFEGLGIMWPTFSAYLVACSEVFFGLLLLVGLFSRVAAVPLVIAMVTAYMTAHFDAVKALVTNPEMFVNESPFLYMLTALLVWAFGPGMFSLDFVMDKLFWRKK